MAYRTFVDPGGREWEVWDVFPRGIMLAAPERRLVGDRRSQPPPQELIERRTALRRVAVSPGLEKGWLAFRSGEERRRQCPIPEHWETMTDAQLSEQCDQARCVPTVAGVLTTEHHENRAIRKPKIP